MRSYGIDSPPDTNCVADRCAHEYDSLQLVSQKRRKTRMRRDMIDRRIQARECGA